MPGEKNSLIMNNKNILQAVFCALKRDGSIQKKCETLFLPIPPHQSTPIYASKSQRLQKYTRPTINWDRFPNNHGDET